MRWASRRMIYRNESPNERMMQSNILARRAPVDILIPFTYPALMWSLIYASCDERSIGANKVPAILRFKI